MNSEIQYLKWDSGFFEKKIGRIDIENNDDLKTLLNVAKNADYQLVYVFGNEVFYAEEEILRKFNGHLADRKVVYHKEIKTITETPIFVFEYENNILTSELEELAYQSGEYSRFKLDKNFGEEVFYSMYKTWMEKSVKKQMADHVFVIKENELIKAMITLKTDAGNGDIGLFAVSSDVQGKGYGKALVVACEKELLSKNIAKLKFPTQLANKNACSFYEKYGFTIHSITNIYHFWL
jgi:ribosomal protein S18 acetylase RimI-like enzyme